MRKLLNLITILCTTTICIAQNRHTITATVMDSVNKEPLELATVAVLQVKDSSLVSYTLTDKKGRFTLRNIKDNVPVRLLVSYVGYESLHIPVNFQKTELLNMGNLYFTSRKLTEVTIKGEVVPIVIKKDTIEFNAEAFKVRPNALVQDLLRKLPGMQVDRDGSLIFNGKQVSKVKVDGREFFGNNYKIVTQNLDADMIAKVQVYDDRENDPDHLQPDYQVTKIINLKFKKEFTKSTFGKIGVGGGTQDRYKVNGLYNKSINDLQMSIISNSNNLSGTDFVSGMSPFQFGPRSGVQQNTTTSVNVNDNFGKTVKLNLTYDLNNMVTNNNSFRNVAQFFHDTTLTNNSNNISHNVNTSQTLAAILDWNPDAKTSFKYSPKLNYTTNGANNTGESTSFNNFTPILSKIANNSNSNGTSTQYQHSIIYIKSLKKKGESFTFINNINVNPSKGLGYSVNDLASFVAGLTSDTLHRLANNTGRTTSVDLSAAYHNPLSKTITGGITFTGNYTSMGANLFTYDQDLKTGLYNVFLANQSSDLTRNQWLQTAHPEIVYRKKSINFNVGFIAEMLQLNNQFNSNMPDLNQHFVYLFPAISLTINRINIGYSEDVQQPSISDMQPITIVYSQLSSFKGNPDLKPTRVRNFSVSYNNFNPQSFTSTNLSWRVIQDDNSITRENLVDAQGVTLSTPINGRGRFTTYVNANISRQFKKAGEWEFRVNTSINGGFGHNYYLVNNQPAFQDTYFLPVKEQLYIYWNDMISIEPYYSVNPSITKYRMANLPGYSYVQQGAGVPLNVRWPKRIIWDVNYDFYYNPLVAQGFQRKTNLLSLSIARQLQKKDKGEFRLTCYDLFNQSVSVTHFASNNSINDIQNQTIKRYFMLSYSYRFNTVTTKEKR